MSIDLDSFRAVAGSSRSIGYAVINSEGTRLSKAAARRTFTLLNHEPGDSIDHSCVRRMFFNALRDGLSADQAITANRREEFLDKVRKELGITVSRSGRSATFSSKPLERRSIRAILAVYDSLSSEAVSEARLSQNAKRVGGLLSRANFADVQDVGELARLAEAVERVRKGKTIAEDIAVGDGRALVFMRDDRVWLKMDGMVFAPNIGPDFLDGVRVRLFECLDRISSRASAQELLNGVRHLADVYPVLDPKAQLAALLARTYIGSHFPEGLDWNEFNGLSPKMLVRLADDVYNGRLTTPETVMEQVRRYIGPYNALTGEERADGQENELGLPVDRNINTQENDYLVSKFLDLQAEEQERVRFAEGVRERAPEQRADDRELSRVFGEYEKEFKEKIGYEKQCRAVVSEIGKNIVGKVGEIADAFSSLLGIFSGSGLGSEEDLEGCQRLFGSALEPHAASPKTGFLALFLGEIEESDSKEEPSEEPVNTDVSPEEVRELLSDSDNCAFIVRLLCEAGDDHENLAGLRGYAKRAESLVNACGELEEIRDIADLIGPGREKQVAAELEKRLHPFAGEDGEAVLALAERFMSKPGDRRNSQALLAGNPKNIAVAANLIAAGGHLDEVPENGRVKIITLHHQLVADLGEIVLRPEDPEAGTSELLLKNACRYSDRELLVEKLTELFVNTQPGERVFNEQELQNGRAAFADLLQDADSWEMDRLAGTPGARLAYSLGKDVAVFARYLCNPGNVERLGKPVDEIAETFLGLLRERLLTDDLRAEFRPGNEDRAVKLLTAVVGSDTIKGYLPLIEGVLENKIVLESRRMQAVTTSLFANMLAGGGVEMDVEQIRGDFDWLSDLARRADKGRIQNEVAAADAALAIIGGLPGGMTVVDFRKAYTDFFPENGPSASSSEALSARLTQTIGLINRLAEYPGATSADVVNAQHRLRSLRGGKETDALPTFDEAVTEIIARLPQGVSVDEYARVFDGLRQDDPNAGYEVLVDKMTEFVAAAVAHGADLADVAALAKALKRGGSEVSCGDCLAQRPENVLPVNFAADFLVIFNHDQLGASNVENTVQLLSRLPAGSRARDLISLIEEGVAKDDAVEQLKILPSFRTSAEVDEVIACLQEGLLNGERIERKDVMYALRKLSGFAKEIGSSLVRVRELSGEARLTVREAVKLLALGADVGSIVKAAAGVGELVNGAHPNDCERLAMAAISQAMSRRMQNEEWITTDILMNFLAKFKDNFSAVSLRQALAEIKAEPPDAKDPSAAPAVLRANRPIRVPLHTAPFNPARDRYHNLVQMLRENGMNTEADEIDVEIRRPPERQGAQNDQTAYEEECAKLTQRRLELSRVLLRKMSASATDTTKGYGQFMCKAMNRYFRSLGTVDARTMFSSACRYAKGDDALSLLGAMLKGAGPIMQKMLQGLAGLEGLPKEFIAALSDMRSNLSDIPQTEVRAQLRELVKVSDGVIESVTVTRPLGAASVGQAFLCMMKLRGEANPRPVVVKILRPDALPRVQREREVFAAAAAEVPGMSVTFEGQLAGIMEELDLRQEARNVEAGQVYDRGRNDIRSMKLVPGVPTLRNVMVVEQAPGMTADRFFNDAREKISHAVEPFRNAGRRSGLVDGAYSMNVTESPDRCIELYAEAQRNLRHIYEDTLLQQRRLVGLAEAWANEGIYNGGFYHGDLHAGNIMLDGVRRDEGGNVVNGSGNGGLTVIDFGNATQLTNEQKKAVMRMMMASTLRNTDRFLDNFAVLMTPDGRRRFEANRNQGEKLHDLVHEILHLGDQTDSEKRIFAVLQQLMLVGYEMPGAVYKFAQCAMRLQGTIAECNAVLESVRQEMYRLRTASSSFFNLPNFDPSKMFITAKRTVNTNGYESEADLTGVTSLPSDSRDFVKRFVEGVVGCISSRRETVEEELQEVIRRCGDLDPAVPGDTFKEDCAALMKLVQAAVTRQNELRNLVQQLKTRDDEAAQHRPDAGLPASVDHILNALMNDMNTRNRCEKIAENMLLSLREGNFKLDEDLHRSVHEVEGEESEEELEEIQNPTTSFETECIMMGMFDSVEQSSLVDGALRFFEGRCAEIEDDLRKREKGGEFASVTKTDAELLAGAVDLVMSEEKLIDQAVLRKTLLVSLAGTDRRLSACLYFKLLQCQNHERRQLARTEIGYDNCREQFDRLVKTLSQDGGVLEKVATGLFDRYSRNVSNPLKEKLTVPEDSVPVGPCELADFFRAIGNVIMSHLDQDLQRLDFHEHALASTMYLVKGLPSIIATTSRFGFRLSGDSFMHSRNIQLPD